MKSKKATWLTIILIILAVPITGLLFKMIILNYASANSGISYFINITFRELILVIIVLLANRFIVHQKITFQNDDTFKNAFLPTVITLGMLLVMTNGTLLSHGLKINRILVIGILAILVGVFEETLCRGILLPQVLKLYRKLGVASVYQAVFFSSLIFGSLHFTNLTRQNLDTTIVQVVFATAFGCFLCALYIRSGALWLTIAVHALWDFRGFYASGSINDTAIHSVGPQIIIASLAIFVFFAGFALINLRPSKLKQRMKWLEQITE